MVYETQAQVVGEQLEHNLSNALSSAIEEHLGTGTDTQPPVTSKPESESKSESEPEPVTTSTHRAEEKSIKRN